MSRKVNKINQIQRTRQQSTFCHWTAPEKENVAPLSLAPRLTLNPRLSKKSRQLPPWKCLESVRVTHTESIYKFCTGRLLDCASSRPDHDPYRPNGRTLTLKDAPEVASVMGSCLLHEVEYEKTIGGLKTTSHGLYSPRPSHQTLVTDRKRSSNTRKPWIVLV